ncbi:MAG TPA: hypothetical protein VJA21_31205 [Verrucomicrobiae bacterium]
MLTTLSTVKSRLGILETDTQYDALLTTAIKATSARFDRETRRTLARQVDATDEFFPDDTEIIATRYPIESVTKFELKTDETEGWAEQTGIKYLVCSASIISLPSPLAFSLQPLAFPATARVTYTGGYVLPGTTPGAGQTALPDDLEQAAVEQVAFWFQKRDHQGIRTSWPYNGEYKQYASLDLLPPVAAVLRSYERISI